MKWQFGIREKFALVAILLVILSAYLLRTFLFEGTTAIVVEHELVDLQDEGDLRCWTVADSVEFLRNEVARTAAHPEQLEDGIKVLEMHTQKIKTPPGETLVMESEHFTRGSVQWWENVLAVRKVHLTGGEIESLFEPNIDVPVVPQYLIEAVTRTPEVEPIPLNSGPDTPPEPPADPTSVPSPAPAVAPALRAQQNLPTTLVSTLFGLDLPVGYLNTRQVSDEETDNTKTQNLVRVPVMWGICRLPHEADKALAILLPVSVGTSPRHLTFIFDNEGNYLQHPRPKLNPTPGESNVQPVYKDIDLHEEALKILRRESGFSGADLNRRVQRGALLDYIPLDDQTDFFYLEGTATDELHAAIRAQAQDPEEQSEEFSPDDFDEDNWSWMISRRMADMHVRFGGPNSTNRSFRLLGQSEEMINNAKEFVEKHYAVRYPEVKNFVKWHNSIKHRTGDVYIARFRLDLEPIERPLGPNSPDPYYYFASAVFREELAFSVGSEFEKLERQGALLALVSGIAAFLVALFFVRPLRRITGAAQQVTSQGSDAAELQHKIEEVRRSLPVKKRDEVGDIARALESLLRQVLNGHEQLRQLNADLDGKVREQTKELRDANDELRGLAAAKDEFLASVSHELRQPLNSIFGYLQFLEMSDLDEEQRGDVEKTHMAARYLHRLINDILDYQKIIMGGMELEPAEFEADEFFQNLEDSMQPQAAERNNQLVFEGTDSLGTLNNDRARLMQIMVNLISNACKFTGEGKVTVSGERESTDSDGDQIILKVADSGRGMKPEEMDQLFVKFKKLAAREGNKTGTGLGLVICKGLSELMNGSISCESEFGKGTTFTVAIPASVAEGKVTAREPQPSPELISKHVSHTPTSKRPLILVIDDDETVCALMKRFLTGHGYDVVTASNGTEGLTLAKERQPAVITLDVVLPGKDGWEVLSDLKSDPDTSDIPVIMVTFIEEKTHGYTLGADDYLVKPVDWDDFSRRINKVMGRSGEDDKAGAPVLVVDDDPDTRTLFRRTLEQDGMSVVEAENGKDALAKVGIEKPSTIVLDLMMPVMDGFEFVENLRANPEWRDIPIIVVTAKSTNSDDRQRLEGGVREILNKGGSEQGNLLGDILNLVHRHAPSAHKGDSTNDDN